MDIKEMIMAMRFAYHGCILGICARIIKISEKVSSDVRNIADRQCHKALDCARELGWDVDSASDGN